MKHVCRRCVSACRSEPVLLDYMERCINQQPTNITFSWNDHLKFEDYHMKIPLPIRVYADFECINQPQNDPKVLFKQIPIAIGFYLSLPSGNKNSKTGSACYSHFGTVFVEWFVNENLKLEHRVSDYLKTNKPLELSPEEEEQFEQTTSCWLCEEPFSSSDTVSLALHTEGA